MEERICKVCGNKLTIDNFPKIGEYYRHICKKCQNQKAREWRKSKKENGENQNPINPSYSEKIKRRIALERAQRKLQTGTTYRSEEEAEKRRAYQREYEKQHRKDPHKKRVQSKCNKNYRERKKMKAEVAMLDEFFGNDFLD